MNTMKKLMMVAAATVAAWCSWGVESISVDKVVNHYPWDGKVDCVYTLSGLENWRFYEGVFELSVEKAGVAVRRAITNELANVNGTYTNTFDCTALFGAGCYPNGGISVKLVKKMDGVQLWAGGPYFATCNVGASQPQEDGYYFWWGDTVGYKRNAANDGWKAVDGEAPGFLFTDENEKIETWNKDVSWLTSAGYIDASSGNLVAAHDAATAHLGAPWRLPTAAEIQALTNNCTTTLTNNWNGTGVCGQLFTGKGDYASKSVFFPATGYGMSNSHSNIGIGYAWSSTPASSGTYPTHNAQCLNLEPNFIYLSDRGNRTSGRPVRPVRSAE